MTRDEFMGDVASDIGRVTSSISEGAQGVIGKVGETQAGAYQDVINSAVIGGIALLLVGYLLFKE